MGKKELFYSIICSVKLTNISFDIFASFARETFFLGLAYCRAECHHEDLHHTFYPRNKLITLLRWSDYYYYHHYS